MRCYYYYYTHKLGFGCGLCKSESKTFPLANRTKYVRENTEPSATISFWREIPYEEYEEMIKIMNEYNDERDTMMNEILKKRIEEAADTEMSQYYNDDEYPCGIKDIQSDFKEAFKIGAEYALSHQFISVQDSLPEYNKAVLIIDKTGIEGNGVYFNHRSNNPIVKTYENGFCDIGLSEVMYWCEVPKFKPL